MKCVWVGEGCLKDFVGDLEGDCGVWSVVGGGGCGGKVFCGVKSLGGGEGVGDGEVRFGKGVREELGVEVGGKIWVGVDAKIEVLKEVTFCLSQENAESQDAIDNGQLLDSVIYPYLQRYNSLNIPINSGAKISIKSESKTYDFTLTLADNLTHGLLRIKSETDAEDQSRKSPEKSVSSDLKPPKNTQSAICTGYATDETEESLPLSYSLACNLISKLDECHKNNTLPWVGPDRSAQVTLDYETDPKTLRLKPTRVHTVLLRVQHSPDVSINELEKQILENVLTKSIPQKFIDPETKFIINPEGTFTIGGPSRCSGMSQKKICSETYGGWILSNPGGLSGKDGNSLERTGSYQARLVAKSLVKNGFCARCWVQLVWYAGQDEVGHVSVDSFGSGMVGMTDGELVGVVRRNFGLGVGGLGGFDGFGLKKPIFKGVCTTGHYNVSFFFFLWNCDRGISCTGGRR